ncbi:MAG: BLUF domain-containing protein, partial [Anaerolineales bacterium]
MSPLIHLIYSSAASHPLSEEELAKLLIISRANNAARGITGMLLHAEGSFFQVLEGESAAVDALFERISRDARHTNLTVIIREPIARRAFGEWTMGFLDVKSEELREMMGVNDLFGAGTYLSNISPGRAKKLLAAFTQGRWR